MFISLELQRCYLYDPNSLKMIPQGMPTPPNWTSGILDKFDKMDFLEQVDKWFLKIKNERIERVFNRKQRIKVNYANRICKDGAIWLCCGISTY